MAKVVQVEKKKGSFSIYLVTVRPNFFERLFGYKTKTIEVKSTGSTYSFGGGTVYVYKSGKKLGNGSYIGEAIDQYKRKF